MAILTHCRRAALALLSLVIIAFWGCGGGGSSSQSNLTMRAFVSNDFDGTLHIEDARQDIESAFKITVGANPGAMVLSPDKTLTLVFCAGTLELAVVANVTETAAGTAAGRVAETVAGRVSLPDITTSYVALSNNATGFAAVHNAAQTGGSQALGVVEVMDIVTNFSITQTINVTNAKTLVLSPDGKKLLVFPDAADHVNTVTMIGINTSTSPPTIATPTTAVASFDQPVSAVFSADSSKAYVMNCGPECGGVTAGITVLDMTQSTPVQVGAPIPIAGGATFGLLNGNNLYVAGTPGGVLGVQKGMLTVVDTSSMTAGAAAALSDGYHNEMQLVSNNKLFIGAINCTNNPSISGSGCLSIFDVSQNKCVFFSNAIANPGTTGVTGIAQIGSRNVVYVVERGELQIYDTTTNALTGTQIDVVGAAVDVKYVDK